MPRLSELRRGRSIQTRAKRARLRRRKPRFAVNKLISEFRVKPRRPRPTQPYLGTDVNIADLIN